MTPIPFYQICKGGPWVVGGARLNHMVGFSYIRQALMEIKVSSLELCSASDIEVASSAVSSAVHRAQDRLRKKSPEVSTHVTGKLLTVGYYVTYNGALSWEVNPGLVYHDGVQVACKSRASDIG